MSERGDVKTRFQKGQSGNPGGKPKGNPLFREGARKAVDEHVLQAWIDEVVTRGKDWVKASELLAAYGYGKPSSSPEDLAALQQASARPLLGITTDAVLAALKASEP